MARGRKARASNKGPRAGGRGPRASGSVPLDAAMLRELLERSRKALAELDNLFSESKRYFDEVINNITREFKLTEEEVNELNRFKETMLELLDRAHTQARERLPKLVAALEKYLEGGEGAVTLERFRKVLRVRPAGESWFISAWLPSRGSWRFELLIHGVSGKTVFPDVVRWSPADLESAQAGWRASDESYSKTGRPTMGTTHPWQLLAWSVTRYGRLHIAIASLHLNKRQPSIEWRLIAKDWVQQWRDPSGKRLAREIARANPLGLLTLYLGDGHKHPEAFAVSVGSDDEYYKIASIPGIVRKAYETAYGKLLDIIRCDKWLALKNLTPKRDPVHAAFNGHIFWLCYSHSAALLNARTVTKSEKEARECAQLLAALGVQANVYKRLNKYWVIHLKGREVLKLAERFPEWRNALRELAEKKKIEPRGPVARKLLELAESPPLPARSKTFNPLFKARSGP
jgi:hypothetical protein